MPSSVPPRAPPRPLLPPAPAVLPTRFGVVAARLRWPAPALLGWLFGWLAFVLLRRAGLESMPALLVATAAPALLAWRWPVAGGLRRTVVIGGFPLALLDSSLGLSLPGWLWLLPLALLLLVYPLRAWRDAPWFPTPPQALRALPGWLMLRPGARLLDAGCGIGDGLLALRRCWPDARVDGIEWSWPLARLAALRCRHASVRRGDMWGADWSVYALVYLFQRPESMARAWAKAAAEMAPGSWLASLDFAVPGVLPAAVLRRPGAQTVWLYRIAKRPARAQSARCGADKRSSLPALCGSH